MILDMYSDLDIIRNDWQKIRWCTVLKKWPPLFLSSLSNFIELHHFVFVCKFHVLDTLQFIISHQNMESQWTLHHFVLINVLSLSNLTFEPHHEKRGLKIFVIVIPKECLFGTSPAKHSFGNGMTPTTEFTLFSS